MHAKIRKTAGVACFVLLFYLCLSLIEPWIQVQELSSIVYKKQYKKMVLQREIKVMDSNQLNDYFLVSY